MKSIRGLEYQEIHVELKYCERCGGLWLRQEGITRVHCASCHLVLEASRRLKEAVAPAGQCKRRGLDANGQDANRGRSARIECIRGRAAMEVGA
jgi:hypothetical protein